MPTIFGGDGGAEKVNYNNNFLCMISGAAVSILILTYIRCLLHGLEMSYALYFCFASMQSPLPWVSLNNDNDTSR